MQAECRPEGRYQTSVDPEKTSRQLAPCRNKLAQVWEGKMEASRMLVKRFVLRVTLLELFAFI